MTLDVLVLGALIVLQGMSTVLVTTLVIRAVHRDTERTLAEISRLIVREGGRTRTTIRRTP